MNVVDLAKTSLRKHEGLRTTIYTCSAGKPTIGYGRNLLDKGVTPKEAEMLLDADITECYMDLDTFDYWVALSHTRKAALIDLRFCLGGAGYRAFKKMNVALSAGDWSKAAAEVLDSKFATQTGSRADDIAQMLIAG
jgi:lysozyme